MKHYTLLTYLPNKKNSEVSILADDDEFIETIRSTLKENQRLVASNTPVLMSFVYESDSTCNIRYSHVVDAIQKKQQQLALERRETIDWQTAYDEIEQDIRMLFDIALSDLRRRGTDADINDV